MNNKYLTTRLLLPLALISPFFLGFESSGFQLALLSIGSEFNLNNASMGSLVSIQYTAFIIGPLLISLVIDKIGKKAVTMIALFAFSTGCFGLLGASTVLLFMAGIFIVGFGLSVCQSAMSSALSDAYPGKAGKYINLSQGFYSLGAVIGPLAVQYAMDTFNFTWRIVFSISGIGILLLIVPLFFTKLTNYDKTKIKTGYETEKDFSSELLKTPAANIFSKKAFILILVSIIFYVSYENGATFFFNSFFSSELQSPKLSPYSISIFWGAMVISRFLGSVFHSHKIRLVIGGFSGASLSFFFLTTSNNPYLALFFCFLLGIFSGPIWPTLLGLATEEAPEKSGAIASIVMCVSGIGGALAPVIMGFFADILSIRASFGALILFATAGIITAFSVSYLHKKTS